MRIQSRADQARTATARRRCRLRHSSMPRCVGKRLAARYTDPSLQPPAVGAVDVDIVGSCASPAITVGRFIGVTRWGDANSADSVLSAVQLRWDAGARWTSSPSGLMLSMKRPRK